MSNLAYKYQQQQTQKKQAEVKQKAVYIERGRITKGEKLLWMMLVLAFVTASIFMVSNYASIYNLNTSIQQVESEQRAQLKQNEELQVKVTELSAPDRIMDIAQNELGMKLNDQNVEVVNKGS
ncbi:cell division protein FtsL [Pseudalkalibacillus hwajinpoensis]|uniref:Cell division protein FtsL n=1 Tax=Guptibacillus hwajinpoensis TaxID=208199 RepID=A0A4U1MKQ6_9BACL|nr:cell division protein FtsL [Pseudalkalibacillus hwajinpoensis]TKD71753.1 cell division protein FtsL [Pseudalkalibacillus hwajinpoensis]